MDLPYYDPEKKQVCFDKKKDYYLLSYGGVPVKIDMDQFINVDRPDNEEIFFNSLEKLIDKLSDYIGRHIYYSNMKFLGYIIPLNERIPDASELRGLYNSYILFKDIYVKYKLSSNI